MAETGIGIGEVRLFFNKIRKSTFFVASTTISLHCTNGVFQESVPVANNDQEWFVVPLLFVSIFTVSSSSMTKPMKLPLQLDMRLYS